MENSKDIDSSKRSPAIEALRLTAPEEEVAFLCMRAAQRERAVEAGKERMSRGEIISDEVRKYEQAPIEEVLTDERAMKINEIEEKVLHLSTEHEEAVDELLGVAEVRGIKNALEIAKGLDLHIRDDFHRLLVQYLAEFGSVPGLKEGTPIFKSLRLRLFEIAIPKVLPDGSDRKFSEIVSEMEQFYAGMLSVAENVGGGSYSGAKYFTIEIAKSNYEDEVVFFCAVPRSKERLFEKQLLTIFPDAIVRERKDDYNPFSASGVTLISTASLRNNAILPIRTYDTFDNDPIDIVLGSFSNIQREGEAAAIQLVFSPAGDKYNKKYARALSRVRAGESLERATEHEGVRIAKDVGAALLDTFFGDSSKKKDDVSRDKMEHKEEQEVVDNIVKKIESPIVDINIRIVVSAGNIEDAEKILTEIEAAFNQFEGPNGNGLKFKRLNGKKHSEEIHRFIYRIYNEDIGVPLNLREVTTLFHFPVTTPSVTNLRKVAAKRAPAPANVSGEGILLGVNRYRTDETEVHFKREDRVRHFYVIGQTGTGKTTLLKNMIIQDIVNGDGVCMIDPHGSDIDDVLANIPKERIDDVIYFDPAYTARPMGLNMLEYDTQYPEQKTFVVNELFSIFQKLYSGSPESMGPMFEQYFRNTAMLVVEDPETGNTLLEVSRVLSDEKFRERKLSRCKNPIVVQFWREVATKAGGEAALANIVPYITSKFDVFMANEIMRPIIAQEKSAFSFRQVMDERKILLVNLSKGRLGDINSSLIGLIVVGKILMAALSRVDAPKGVRPDFYLYIDEFQNVTTDSISTILSEARKYRLSLNIAHQFIAQLEDGIRDSVFGNVGSMAVYRVGSEDAEFLEKQLSPVFSAQDIVNIDNFNAYVKLLVNGSPTEPFSMTAMRPPEGRPEIVEDIKELSRLKYGRPREEIEGEIARKYMQK